MQPRVTCGKASSVFMERHWLDETFISRARWLKSFQDWWIFSVFTTSTCPNTHGLKCHAWVPADLKEQKASSVKSLKRFVPLSQTFHTAQNQYQFRIFSDYPHKSAWNLGVTWLPSKLYWTHLHLPGMQTCLLLALERSVQPFWLCYPTHPAGTCHLSSWLLQGY